MVPRNLKFPPGVIRNILIERGSNRVIINIKQVSIIEDNFSMEGRVDHWDRHKKEIKAKYYKKIMKELHPEQKGLEEK